MERVEVVVNLGVEMEECKAVVVYKAVVMEA